MNTIRDGRAAGVGVVVTVGGRAMVLVVNGPFVADAVLALADLLAPGAPEHAASNRADATAAIASGS
ncbi:MAG: hypothetical protein ABIP53_00135 [Candidatus Limnocylindrales bacterium]